MKEDILNSISDITVRMSHLKEFLHIENKLEKIDFLEAQMNRPDFWDNTDEANRQITELAFLKNQTMPFLDILKESEDFETLKELIKDENEESEFLRETEASLKILSEKLDKLEILCFLSGKLDNNTALLTVFAGEGGTEACDWCEMLARMYSMYASKNGLKCVPVSAEPGLTAGLKNITFRISGEFAYGYMKAEKGVHRLVRISPFDSNKRRHTSFASVDVIPEIDKSINIEINMGDCKIDTYRASGAGGQHINRTDSAVRITHKPTGIVVSCQTERSQHQNKEIAIDMLKAKLYAIEEEKQAADKNAESTAKGDNAWGNQIRSYVFCPYQMVKDLRTGFIDRNIDFVMDGNIQEFITAWLKAGCPKTKFRDKE